MSNVFVSFLLHSTTCLYSLLYPHFLNILCFPSPISVLYFTCPPYPSFIVTFICDVSASDPFSSSCCFPSLRFALICCYLD
jgi:hypothetical protein